MSDEVEAFLSSLPEELERIARALRGPDPGTLSLRPSRSATAAGRSWSTVGMGR